MGAYQLKITVKGTQPPIWRRILAPDQITFENLHEIIQTAFCWGNYHLYEFEFPSRQIRMAGSPDGDDVAWEGDCGSCGEVIDELVYDAKKFNYTYDFGDNWEHVIQVEKYVPEYQNRFAQVVKYKGDVIPEDCGGIWGYYELLHTLSDPVKTKKADEDYGMDYRGWAEEQGLEEYDMDAVNRKLAVMIFPETKKQRRIGKRQTSSRRNILDDIWEEGEFEPYLELDKDEMLAMLAEVAQTPFYFNENLGRCIKKNIQELARYHCMNAVSKLKKNDLIEQIREKILSEEYMRGYFSYVTDSEMEVFKRIISGAYYREYIEEDRGANLDYLYWGAYIFENPLGIYVIPQEVKEAFQRINTPEFEKRRRCGSFVFECLFVSNIIYAIAPDTVILRMLRENGEPDMTLEKLEEEYYRMEPYRKAAKYFSGEFMDPELSGTEAEDYIRMSVWGDIPYYIPSREEIKKLKENDGVNMNPQMKELGSFLLNEAGMDYYELISVMMMIQVIITMNEPIQEFVDYLMEDPLKSLESFQKKRFLKIFMDVWMNTRMYEFCGHTPAEISGSKSVERPVLQLRGTKMDKIYPNDPCPCGSGKKYKQCCGKK